MKYRFVTIFAGLLAVASAEACVGQEPGEKASVEELRREVTELRKAVAELTKRLEELEYQKLPRVGTITPKPNAANRVTPEIPKNFRFPIDIERGNAPLVPKMPKSYPWLR